MLLALKRSANWKFFALLFCFGSAHAQGVLKQYYWTDGVSVTDEEYAQTLEDFETRIKPSLAKIDGTLASMTVKSLTPKGLTKQEEKIFRTCQEFYGPILAKRQLTIRLVYGYYDSFLADGTSLTLDESDLGLLADSFTTPCASANSFACGFRKTKIRGLAAYFFRIPIHLVRDVVGPNGQTIRVRLELIHSSATPSDRFNRSELDFNRPGTEQELQSKAAESTFYSGFRESDVLIYEGHAREGGGPSFAPPILKTDISGPVKEPIDFAYYKRAKPGFTKMIEAMTASEHAPRLLAMFACKSAVYFVDAIHSSPFSSRFSQALQKGHTGFLGTSGLTDSSADYGNTLGLIDSLVAMRCGAKFKSTVSIRIPGSRTVFEGELP